MKNLFRNKLINKKQGIKSKTLNTFSGHLQKNPFYSILRLHLGNVFPYNYHCMEKHFPDVIEVWNKKDFFEDGQKRFLES